MHKNQPEWAFALHGGAGAIAGRDYTATEEHLQELAAACRHKLANGGRALDVVEFAVAELESCGLYVAGRGSAPNSAGYVELDASIMDGGSREAGAVAALRDFVSPIGVARAVMEKTPHVMLTGAGAAAFARREGFADIPDPSAYYRLPVGVTRDDVGDIAHGTVGAVALDRNGQLAAATSTGGTFGKLEGRVGDTPLIGPGTWADDTVAISCTGVGEHIIRSGGASSVAFRLRSGLSLSEAAQEMLNEVARLGGDGGLIAVHRDGTVVMPYNSQGMKRASATSETAIVVQTFSGGQ
jgi:isoaspartyl peptidase/L-asparaginase-like protein (Ntn-hydrolase superfamily)